jgi:hypothetical protein
VTSLCRKAACRIASNMSRSLLLAAPSVPRSTATPRRSAVTERCRSQASVALGCARRRHAAAPGSGCWRSPRPHAPRCLCPVRSTRGNRSAPSRIRARGLQFVLSRPGGDHLRVLAVSHGPDRAQGLRIAVHRVRRCRRSGRPRRTP